MSEQELSRAARHLADSGAPLAEHITAMADVLQRSAEGAMPRLGPAAARRLAWHQVVAMIEAFQGQQPYYPRLTRLRACLLDLQLWAEHDGTTNGPNGIHALAQRHRMGPERVWERLKRQRQRNQALRARREGET